MPNARALLIELSIIAGLGLFLALLGPFGSFQSALADRLLYWLGLGVGGYLLFRPAMMAATAVARRLDLPEAAAWIAGCLIAAIPMSLVVWWVSPGGPRRSPTGPEWLELYANVAVVAAGVTLVFWIVGTPARRAAAAAPRTHDTFPGHAAERPEEPRFLDRLPKHLGRDLVALEMEDHYVRAHTAAGSALPDAHARCCSRARWARRSSGSSQLVGGSRCGRAHSAGRAQHAAQAAKRDRRARCPQ